MQGHAIVPVEVGRFISGQRDVWDAASEMSQFSSEGVYRDFHDGPAITSDSFQSVGVQRQQAAAFASRL